MVLEADAEPGGYCRTVVRDGFVWDYSGHFFHFKHPEIEAWLRARMPGQDVRTVVKRVATIRYAGRDIDFPFQKNIHQLPHAEFLECLVDLFFRPMATRRRGRSARCCTAGSASGITEKFLRPYNEKLYATNLDTLDRRRDGPVLPARRHRGHHREHAAGDQATRGYNATFTYPAGRRDRSTSTRCSRDLPAGTVALRRAGDRDRSRRARSRSRRRGGSAYAHVVSAPRRCPRSRGCASVAARRGGVHVEPGARVQPRVRPQGHARHPLDVLPRSRALVLPGRLVRQHPRQRSDEPLRRDRRCRHGARARRRRAARARARRSRAREHRRRSPARRAAPRRARSGVRAHHARRRSPRPRGCAACSRREASTRSAATAAGPTARSRTT